LILDVKFRTEDVDFFLPSPMLLDVSDKNFNNNNSPQIKEKKKTYEITPYFKSFKEFLQYNTNECKIFLV